MAARLGFEGIRNPENVNGRTVVRDAARVAKTLERIQKKAPTKAPEAKTTTDAVEVDIQAIPAEITRRLDAIISGRGGKVALIAEQ